METTPLTDGFGTGCTQRWADLDTPLQSAEEVTLLGKRWGLATN